MATAALVRGLLFAPSSVTTMAIITAIGGKKANKLLVCWRSRQNGRVIWQIRIFPDETQTRQYFHVGDDKRTTTIFSPIVVIPMVLPFAQSPLSFDTDCTSDFTISELDGGICQLKRNVAVFSIGEPSVAPM